MSADSPNKAQILSGIRVLDFGRFIAGPFCGALLSDMGAEVIRIEKCEGSEDRYLQPVNPEPGEGEAAEGTMFMQMNRNKKCLTLDPMTEEGREIVKRLVKTADVVIANLPAKTFKTMGIDYESLVAIKPDIILTKLSAFGEGGPYSDRTGFDGVVQCMVGSVYLAGQPGMPVKSYAPWVDFGTASFAAFGTVAALMERMKSGKGQVVEGSLLSTGLAYFNFHLMEQDMRQTNRIAIGNRHPYAAPSDLVQTKDGWIFFQVMGDPIFKRWVKLMGEDEWMNDPRFKTDISRADHGEIFSERMSRWALNYTTAEAIEILEKARIPAGPMMTPQQILDDEHVAAMGYLKPTPFPGMSKPAKVMEPPVTLSRTPGAIHRRAPLLGEHTDEILTEIGYSESEIEAFRKKKIV